MTFLHMEFVGPGRVFLVAAVDLTGDDTEAKAAARLAELGRQVEEREVVERAMITLSRSDAPAIDLSEGQLGQDGRVSRSSSARQER